MDALTLLTYLTTVALVVFTPGPSTMLAAAVGADGAGWRVTALAAGDLTANLMQMIVAALGLSAIVAANPGWLRAATWLGVAYLAALGLAHLRPRATAPSDGPRRADTGRRLWVRGFATSMANPKAIVFFTGLFPPFLDPGRAVIPQLGLLAVGWVILDGAAIGGYAVAASRVRHRHPTAAHYIRAGAFLAAATLLAAKGLDVI